MRWIGLDVHHLYIHIAELCEDGTVTHSRVSLDEHGMAALRDRLGEDAEVVLEASTSSFSLYDRLKSYARSVVVAHPAQTRGASSFHVKTDLRDAEVLARLLASGFIRPVWVPPADCRALRSLMELRSKISTLHTATVNQVRACFRSELIEYPSGLSSRRIDEADKVSWLEPHLGATVRSLVVLAGCIQKQLSSIDALLEEWSLATADAQLLRTIPGVGPVVAAVIFSEIGDVHRFPAPSRLCAYAGLVPTVYSSGKTLRIGRLTKRCRHLLRWALWIAALQLVRRDGRFQALYRGLCNRRPKKVALVACSRKLLVVIWHMLHRRQPFQHHPAMPSGADPARTSQARRESAPNVDKSGAPGGA